MLFIVAFGPVMSRGNSSVHDCKLVKEEREGGREGERERERKRTCMQCNLRNLLKCDQIPALKHMRKDLLSLMDLRVQSITGERHSDCGSASR